MTSLLCSLNDLVSGPAPSSKRNAAPRISRLIDDEDLKGQVTEATDSAYRHIDKFADQKISVNFSFTPPEGFQPDSESGRSDLDQTIKLFYDNCRGKKPLLLSQITVEIDPAERSKAITISLSFTKSP